MILEPLLYLTAEGDLRNKIQDTPPFSETFIRQSDVYLGLAGAGDAVQQDIVA